MCVVNVFRPSIVCFYFILSIQWHSCIASFENRCNLPNEILRTIIHQSIETPEDFLSIRNTCEQFRSLAQTLPVKLRVVHDPRVISCKKMSPYPFLNLYVLHRNT